MGNTLNLGSTSIANLIQEESIIQSNYTEQFKTFLASFQQQRNISYGNYRVLRSTISNEKIQQYEVIFHYRDEVTKYLESYFWRKTISQSKIPLVKTKYFQCVSDGSGIIQKRFMDCSRSDVCACQVFIEDIPYRLTNINDIQFPQNLYVLKQALKGFQILYQHLGYIKPSEDLICINRQGLVKVWLNSNLSKNYPNVENIQENMQNFDSESKLINQIITLIDLNTYHQDQPATIRQFMQQKCINAQFLTFGKIFETIDRYQAEYRVKLPKCFESILQVMNNEDQEYDTYKSQIDENRSEVFQFNQPFNRSRFGFTSKVQRKDSRNSVSSRSRKHHKFKNHKAEKQKLNNRQSQRQKSSLRSRPQSVSSSCIGINSNVQVAESIPISKHNQHYANQLLNLEQNDTGKGKRHQRNSQKAHRQKNSSNRQSIFKHPLSIRSHSSINHQTRSQNSENINRPLSNNLNNGNMKKIRDSIPKGKVLNPINNLNQSPSTNHNLEHMNIPLGNNRADIHPDSQLTSINTNANTNRNMNLNGSHQNLKSVQSRQTIINKLSTMQGNINSATNRKEQGQIQQYDQRKDEAAALQQRQTVVSGNQPKIGKQNHQDQISNRDSIDRNADGNRSLNSMIQGQQAQKHSLKGKIQSSGHKKRLSDHQQQVAFKQWPSQISKTISQFVEDEKDVKMNNNINIKSTPKNYASRTPQKGTFAKNQSLQFSSSNQQNEGSPKLTKDKLPAFSIMQSISQSPQIFNKPSKKTVGRSRRNTYIEELPEQSDLMAIDSWLMARKQTDDVEQYMQQKLESYDQELQSNQKNSYKNNFKQKQPQNSHNQSISQAQAQIRRRQLPTTRHNPKFISQSLSQYPYSRYQHPDFRRFQNVQRNIPVQQNQPQINQFHPQPKFKSNPLNIVHPQLFNNFSESQTFRPQNQPQQQQQPQPQPQHQHQPQYFQPFPQPPLTSSPFPQTFQTPATLTHFSQIPSSLTYTNEYIISPTTGNLMPINKPMANSIHNNNVPEQHVGNFNQNSVTFPVESQTLSIKHSTNTDVKLIKTPSKQKQNDALKDQTGVNKDQDQSEKLSEVSDLSQKLRVEPEVNIIQSQRAEDQSKPRNKTHQKSLSQYQNPGKRYKVPFEHPYPIFQIKNNQQPKPLFSSQSQNNQLLSPYFLSPRSSYHDDIQQLTFHQQGFPDSGNGLTRQTITNRSSSKNVSMDDINSQNNRVGRSRPSISRKPFKKRTIVSMYDGGANTVNNFSEYSIIEERYEFTQNRFNQNMLIPKKQENAHTDEKILENQQKQLQVQTQNQNMDKSQDPQISNQNKTEHLRKSISDPFVTAQSPNKQHIPSEHVQPYPQNSQNGNHSAATSSFSSIPQLQNQQPHTHVFLSPQFSQCLNPNLNANNFNFSQHMLPSFANPISSQPLQPYQPFQSFQNISPATDASPLLRMRQVQSIDSPFMKRSNCNSNSQNSSNFMGMNQNQKSNSQYSKNSRSNFNVDLNVDYENKVPQTSAIQGRSNSMNNKIDTQNVFHIKSQNQDVNRHQMNNHQTVNNNIQMAGQNRLRYNSSIKEETEQDSSAMQTTILGLRHMQSDMSDELSNKLKSLTHKYIGTSDTDLHRQLLRRQSQGNKELANRKPNTIEQLSLNIPVLATGRQNKFQEEDEQEDEEEHKKEQAPQQQIVCNNIHKNNIHRLTFNLNDARATETSRSPFYNINSANTGRSYFESSQSDGKNSSNPTNRFFRESKVENIQNLDQRTSPFLQSQYQVSTENQMSSQSWKSPHFLPSSSSGSELNQHNYRHSMYQGFNHQQLQQQQFNQYSYQPLKQPPSNMFQPQPSLLHHHHHHQHQQSTPNPLIQPPLNMIHEQHFEQSVRRHSNRSKDSAVHSNIIQSNKQNSGNLKDSLNGELQKFGQKQILDDMDQEILNDIIGSKGFLMKQQQSV